MTADKEILIVEDNPQSRKLARTLLDLEGFLVLEAENAERALTILDERRPHLILMDMQMPGMNGVELTRAVRDRDDISDTPIVALTAYAMNGDRERFLAAGCDGYISKPIDPATFPGIIKAHLRST